MSDQSKDRPDHAGEDSQELAAERTDLAEDRTVLAHERSFASWLRTGMASVGIAIAFNALFKSFEPTWVAKAIATVFLLIAIWIFHSAERRACTIISKLHAHQVTSLRPVRARLISRAFILATVALGVGVWTLVEL